MNESATAPTGMAPSTHVGEDALTVEQLTEHTSALAQLISDALGADGAVTLTAGPADAQDAPEDLLPPGAVHGVIAGLRDAAGTVQVVLMLEKGLTTPAASDSDPVVPEPWMAPIAAAMERWAADVGGHLVNAMPVADAEQLRHLLVQSPDTTLMAAGLFDGTTLAGSVAVVGRTTASPTSVPASTEPAGQPVASAPVDVQAQASQTSTVTSATPGHVAGDPLLSSSPTDAAFDRITTERRAGSPTLDAMQVLAEVEMKVTAELGRTRMSVSELLSLTPGSLIELDRTAGSPIDLLVNGTLIGRGEVVVVDEEYGIRLTEISGSES